MLRSVLRSAGAVLAGLLVAMVLIVAVEGVGAVLHPFPEGADTSDPEVVKAHVAKFPQWALALVVVAWGFITFVSAWIATRLGTRRHPAHGIAIGALLVLAVVLNIYHLPYPLWFEVLNLVVLPLAAFGGIRMAR